MKACDELSRVEDRWQKLEDEQHLTSVFCLPPAFC